MKNRVAFSFAAVACTLLCAVRVVAEFGAPAVILVGASGDGPVNWPTYVLTRQWGKTAAWIEEPHVHPCDHVAVRESDLAYTIEIVRFDSPAEAAKALAAGWIHVLPIAPVDLLANETAQSPVQVVANVFERPPYELLGVETIRSLADLKGAAIGFAAHSPALNRLLIDQLAKADLRYPRDYYAADFGDEERSFLALQSESISAILASMNQTTRIEDARFHSLPLKMPSHLTFVAAMNRAWLEHEPIQALLMTRAIKRSLRWLTEPRSGEEAIRMLAEDAQLSGIQSRRAYDLIVRAKGALSRDGEPDAAASHSADAIGTPREDEIFSDAATKLSIWAFLERYRCAVSAKDTTLISEYYPDFDGSAWKRYFYDASNLAVGLNRIRVESNGQRVRFSEQHRFEDPNGTRRRPNAILRDWNLQQTGKGWQVISTRALVPDFEP